MTNEAEKILARLQVQDHLAAVLLARSEIIDEFGKDLRLVEDLASVAEYLRAQLNSPAAGSAE